MELESVSRVNLMILCLAAPAILVAQPERIPATIDAGQTIVLRGVVHPLAQQRYDQGPVEASFHLGYIQMVLTPAGAQRSALDQLLAAQQNPASPQFHKWLTPEQYADRFGASPSDLAKIQQWLNTAGFAIQYTARGRDYLAFSGTAAQVEAVFHASVHRYLVNGEAHFAVSSDPLIPAALGPVVGALLGLNDFHLKPLATMRPFASAPAAALSSGILAPSDVATIYDINPLYQEGIDGTGQKIAIVGLADPFLEDVQTFRAKWGLSGANVQAVLAGEDPGINPGALVEADLDLEWSGAIAPGATLVYVYSTDPDVSAYYAIDQNLAPVLSESFGGCETALPAGNSFSYQLEAQKANSQGITWAVAAGDFGAAICDGGGVAMHGLTVSFPASVPEITAVGGTEFNEAGANYWSSLSGANGASAVSYIPETAWNDSIAGTGLVGEAVAGGGGASSIYPKPAWQTGPGVPADGQRDLPDISIAASGLHDPFAFEFSDMPATIGGTSASVQVFAGMLALLNQYTKSDGQGNINTSLYPLAVNSRPCFTTLPWETIWLPARPARRAASTGNWGTTRLRDTIWPPDWDRWTCGTW